MRGSYMVRSVWIITCKMSTAIAYSFMTMDKQQHRNDIKDGSRRCSNNPEKYMNAGYDNSSESGTLSRSGKRRPRKRSSSSSRTKKDPRVKVEIVVQFFKVGEIDTLKEQFNADVIVKAKWREPTLDGQQTAADSIDFARLWSPKLYIENSLGDPKEQIRHRIIYNEKGEAFIYEKRVAKGTFMENLELDDFPFDVQDLTITVASELPISECELIEDKDEHHVVNRQSFVDEQEWHLYVHTECNKKELVIDQVDNSVKRSALSVKCRAARRPGYFVWNIFMITFLICSLAFATFSVDKKLPQNRLQLSFTLVLTAVAFKSVVNSSLPRISYLTYMDKYLLVSMVMLSAVCTWHAIVTRLDDDRADRVENIVLTILSVLYIIYNIGFIVIIYLFPCKKRRIMSQKDREYKPTNVASVFKFLLFPRLRHSFPRYKHKGFLKQNTGSKIQTETPSAGDRTERKQYKCNGQILTPNGSLEQGNETNLSHMTSFRDHKLLENMTSKSGIMDQRRVSSYDIFQTNRTWSREDLPPVYNANGMKRLPEGNIQNRRGSLPLANAMLELRRINKAHVSPILKTHDENKIG